MEDLLNKTTVITLFWQTVKYKQFSMYDCIDFALSMKQEDFRLDNWVFDFLKDKMELKKEDLNKLDLKKLIDVIFNTAFEWFFNTKKVWGKSMPFNAYIMFLCEKMFIWPDELLKTYTPKQIEYWTEWIIYNLNEQTPKWRKQNIINQKMKELKTQDTGKDLEEIKQMENILKSKS